MKLERVVIEDLVKFGEHRGEKRGRRAEERDTLRRVLALRKLPLTPEQERQIAECKDLAIPMRPSPS